MTGAPELSVLGVACSPNSGARTSAVVAAMLSGAARCGCRTALVELGERSHDEVVEHIATADAVILGTPVYRASYSALLKGLLERMDRGQPGAPSGPSAPLKGKAAAVAMTGASAHHFLAADGLRGVLSDFFAVQVLSPSLYLDQGSFRDDVILTDQARALATRHGAALADLGAAVKASARLREMDPLV